MANVVIRTADLGDMADLRRIYTRASLSNEGDRAALQARPELLELSDRSVRDGRTRLAVADGRIVGFATFADADAGLDVEDLFVDPDDMRRGVGARLIGDLVGVARDRGRARLVVVANPHAVPFYRAVGFRSDGTTDTELGPGVHMHLDVLP